jgi:hypothetical protein
MPELNFKPDGKVLQAFMRSNKFVRGIRGPVGSGKSVGCCVEIFRRAAMQAPAPDGIRYTRFAVIRNTQPELKTTTIKTWLDWFPEDQWGKFNWSPPFTHHIRVGDIDCEVIFLALDNDDDVKKLYSLELTGGWCNEVRFMPKIIVDVLTQRVGRYPSARIGGPSWYGVIMDTNSMDPDHWYPMVSGDTPIPDDMPEEEALMLQRPDDWEFFTQPPAMFEVKDVDGRTVAWKLNKNAENLAALPEGYYERQIQGKTRSHILRDVGNQIVVVKEGRTVYARASELIHFSTTKLPIIPNHPLVVGLDFGLTPAACWGQTLHGRWLIQGEMTTQRSGIKQFAEALKPLLLSRYPGCHITIWGDPAGEQSAQTDEQTPFLILGAAGLIAYPASTNDFTIRVETVNGVFARTVDDAKPAILIDPDCRHLRKAVSGGYHYPLIKSAGTTRYAERPAKNMSSHIAEALQYLLVGAGESTIITVGDRVMSAPVVAKRPNRDPFARLGLRRH